MSIDFAEPKLQTTDNRSPALQSHSTKPLLKQNFNSISDSAQRVRLTNNNSALATPMYYSILPPFTINNPDSEHALRVRLTPNTASLANQKPNPNFSHTNYIKYTPANASEVHLT